LISRVIIYWKIKIYSFDLIVFSDNLFFLDILLIKSIKKLTSSKLIFLSGVSPKYLLPQSHKECLPYFDNIFISDPGHKVEWEDLGAQSVHTLPLSAACPKIFQEIINKNKDNKCYDIIFIGNLDSRAYEYRLELLNFLISRGIDIKIWTYMQDKESLENYPLVKNNIQGSAYGKDMIHILSQSKIVLNLHSPSVPSGGNMRLFEIPLTKSLQIADRCPSEWFADGIDIVLFTDKYDLLNKVNYYLIHEEERTNISNNGHKRFLSEHTYHHRVKKILNIMHR
jgi:spore maturation protein CgeB